jgi:hypothetical protein
MTVGPDKAESVPWKQRHCKIRFGHYLDDDEIGLRPEDPNEARVNTWAYGFEPDAVDKGEVVDALLDVANSLRDRLADTPGPGTFYAWYDAQAGQLRCSLASAEEHALPFGNDYLVTTDAHVVVGLLAMDPDPGRITWDQLVVAANEDETATERTPTVVWATRVA